MFKKHVFLIYKDWNTIYENSGINQGSSVILNQSAHENALLNTPGDHKPSQDARAWPRSTLVQGRALTTNPIRQLRSVKKIYTYMF